MSAFTSKINGLRLKRMRASARYVDGSVPFFTSLGVGAHLESWGISASQVTELDRWDRADVPGTDLTVTAAPS